MVSNQKAVVEVTYIRPPDFTRFLKCVRKGRDRVSFLLPTQKYGAKGVQLHQAESWDYDALQKERFISMGQAATELVVLRKLVP